MSYLDYLEDNFCDVCRSPHTGSCAEEKERQGNENQEIERKRQANLNNIKTLKDFYHYFKELNGYTLDLHKKDIERVLERLLINQME